jgi:hypothetical protein
MSEYNITFFFNYLVNLQNHLHGKEHIDSVLQSFALELQ